MSSSVAPAPGSLQPALSRHSERTKCGTSSPAEKSQGPTRQQILRQLHGQHVRIPDLGEMMADWPKDQNIHSEAVNSKILQIIKTHAVNDNVRMRLTKAMLSAQLSGWYAYASRDRIEALTSFQAWMFIIDDMLDQYSLVHKFDLASLHVMLADCRDFVERSLLVADSVETAPLRYKDHDAVVSFDEYAQAVCKSYGDNRPYRARIAKEAIATLDAYQQEALNRYAGRIPTLEEYLGYRGASSCIMQVAVNFEFANGISLPEEVMESEEMRELYRATVAVAYLLNDIVSLRKEIQEGFVENIVVLLSHGNIQKGVDGAVARMEREVAAVREASEAAARRFADTPHRHHVSQLVRNCKNMLRTSWLWSMRTPRYCLWDIIPDADGGYNWTVDAEPEES
ncbi:Presilphiperfolan-8-beta-ol synthase [Colletotrichum tanaceti]|uniref:Terpene synthase n=1 Tax=Colletotrichum tanaceti TaxID=1306861 RepID=A0A4V6DGD4_9PEZI|nr:Presilphiperfolan-8-beta-ol synthase [Colletotrichum tanaceti]TKW52486.1 Presilphiperfolan-8-beta-ol synthase [Colletotrichum tanaceti]